MIQPNELRLKNWINTPDGYMQVCDVLCDSVNTIKHKNITYDEISPIELSPEILEKIEEAVKVGDRGDYWINGVRIPRK